MTFGKLTLEDLPACYDLCVKAFGKYSEYSEVKQAFSEHEDDENAYFLIGKIGDEVVAYTSIAFVHNLFDGEKPHANLWYVCIAEKYRNKGYGKQLFAEIERICKEKGCAFIYFTVLKSNITAQGFYNNLGYKTDDELAFSKLL